VNFEKKLFEQDLYLQTIHGNWNHFKVIIANIVEKFARSEEIMPHKAVHWLNQFNKY